MRAKWKRRRRDEQREAEESVAADAVPLETTGGGRGSGVHRRGGGRVEEPREEREDLQQPATQSEVEIDMVSHAISIKAGITIIIGFFGSLLPSLFLTPPLFLWMYNSQRI